MTPVAPNKSGTTLQADIRSLLNTPELTDIILIPATSADDDSSSSSNFIGTIQDGIPAIKSILAARSPVFRRMLYGDFRECEPCVKKGEVLRVKLDYGGEVLRLLVEFCFTDRLDSLNNNGDSEDEEETSSSSIRDGSNEDNSQVTDDAKDEPTSLSRTARLLTSLSSAAHYFDIPRLEHDILSRLDEVMTAHPSLACVVLDEGSKIMSAEELCTVALERIRARPKAALLPCNNNEACTDIFDSEIHNGELLGGVTALSATLLERVVFDESTSASELTKFTCLQRWVEGCTHPVVTELNEVPSDEDGEENDDNDPSSHPTPTPKSHKQSHMEQKRSIAAHLAQKLDLSLIPASDLDTVSHSNLLSQDDLFKAYRLQALNAERTKSKVFVEGAGISEINGTYIQGGVHEGIPMYNKEGLWKDREEVFRIFLCTYSNGNKSWCISIVPKGKEPGKTTDVDFYECPVQYGSKGGVSGAYGVGENGLGVVPSRGWKLVNFGQPPTPKCSLIAGVSSD